MKKTLFLTVLLAGAISASAASFTMNGINYTTTAANTVEVSSGGTYTGAIVIPSSVTYSSTLYNVTSVGNYAFQGKTELTSITIPSSVTSIGISAFAGCTGLTSISIPSSVISIGNSAFTGCTGLTSVSISSSVTSIGSSVFRGCTGLTSIIIPSSVTAIGNHAFRECTGLISITIPSSVTSIGSSAFYDCTSLASITIPPSVTSISSLAFQGCTNLTSITIPSSVTSIGSNVFQGSKTLVNVSTSNLHYSSLNGVLYNKNQSTLIYCPTAITGVFTIPSTVTSISDYAFYYCSGLTSISIPSSVTSIGSSAFYNCTSLTNIIIPPSVVSISHYAFQECTSLASVTIPPSVTSIGNDAFLGSKTLITVSTSNLHYSSLGGILYNKNQSTLIYCPTTITGAFTIPSTVTSINDNAFYNCTSLTNVSIPSSVTSIGNYAFQGCTSLASIAISSSVISIGISAFQGCSNLATIYSYISTPMSLADSQFSGVSTSTCRLNVPIGTKTLYQARSGWMDFSNITESLLIIGNSFTANGINYTCNGTNTVQIVSKSTFTDTKIPATVNYLGIDYTPTAIGNSTFEYYANFTNITIPATVTSIGNFTFQSCSQLRDIELPAGLLAIGNYTFYNCTALNTIKANPATPPTLGTEVFSLVDKNTCTLSVPKGSLAAYKNALQWKDFLNIVEFTPTDINQTKAMQPTVTPTIATSTITIQTKGSNFSQSLRIFNAQGQLLYETNLVESKVGVDVSNFPVGTYYIKTIDKNSGDQGAGRFIKK